MDIIIDGNIQPSDGFMIGATTSQILDLTLLNKGDMVYGTSTIKVEIGLKIGNTIEYIPMGIYNIDDIEKTDYTIKITAFDNMMKFERNFTTTLGDTLTLQQVASELTRITGVQFTGNLPAYTVKKLEGFSCREVLGYVASVCGGNAIITRDGKFTIVTPKDNYYSIGTSNYFDYKREETKYKIGKISCQSGEEILSKGSIGVDSMELQFENPWVNNTILTDIYTKLNGFEYLGYSMKWQGDPSLDVGDIVTITDKKGVVRKHPILSQKFTYTGGLTAEMGAKGENKNKNEFSGSGPSAKKVERVVMELALINKALIDVAYIGDLTAGNIKFDTASGTIMDLQTLLAKFVTGENGQFLNLTTDNVTISNALIKDVIAKNISVEDLKAGTISTNNFRIKSDNGGIEIVGTTQQFKDKNNKVRIQMGQDTQGNFNFILRGEDGATTLIDHTGIKEKAIADDLIKEKMIAENAVGEKQINYSSLVTGLNKDANTSLIQASKVAIDLTGQKLDVAFNSLKSTVNDTKSKTESNTTSIGVINGQIDTLIKDTIIEENGTTVKLKDSYSTLKQTVNGINATVASHTSSITNLGTNLTNAQNTANSANSLADSKAKVFTSTPTTPYKIGDIWTGGPSGEIMKCKVARASGAYVSTDWEKASKYTDDAKANAVEGNLNTLSGKVTTVESNYASLSQNLEGFKTTVASTYSTKTELSTVDGKITSLTSRVSTAESSITQLNNSIDLSVSSLKKIVQEGNNNLVANSNWFKGPSGWRLSTTLAGNYFYGVSGSIAIEDKYYIRLGHINNNATSIIYADSQKFPVVAGEKITYGGFGSALSNAVIRIFLLFTDNTADISVDNNFMSGYTWLDFTTTNFVKKNLTVTVPSGATRAFVRIRVHKLDTTINTDSSGVISSLMVRKGEEIFEWCPSQGDSFLYIDEQTANLQVNIDDITSRVSSTESSISTINGSVTGLTTRVNTVEQKVTATAITTTISSAINAGTSSITTTQFVMDKTGFTVKNGAIKIQNKAGTNVMTSDTNGNLTITGTFVNKNYNGVDAIKIQDTSIYFYDWERNGRELGIIYSSYITDYPNVRGFSLAHNNEGYMTFGYKTSTGYNSYIVLDKYAKNPAYPAPIRVLESAVFQSAVNMQERVYIPQKICFESAYNARTPQIFKNTSDSRNILVAQISVSAVNDGFTVLSHTGGELFSVLAGQSYPIWCRHNTQVSGDFYATGSKNSLQSTDHYGERLINAYETAEYYFGDIGSGVIKDGECIVWIDDIFQECINTDVEYHVFTQVYHGSITRIERYKNYFIVHGEDNAEFSWELKAKRIGYENVRLDQPSIEGYLDNTSIFTEEDLKVDTSEDTLMEELDFNLEEVLMEVI